jgi:hypothetical protein
LAGKTVEEIKREAVRDKETTEELSKASNENNKNVPSSGSPSLAISSGQMPTSKPPNLYVLFPIEINFWQMYQTHNSIRFFP